MTNKTVTVVGATGRLGQLVTRELLARGASVVAPVRNPDKPEARELATAGAQVVALDPVRATPAELTQKLAGSYALVSALQGGPDLIIEAQGRLLEAARQAKVRRFLPSDYSFNFFTLPEGVNVNSDWRRAFALQAREQRGQVEVVHLMQGMFADAAVLGFVGLYDRAQNRVRYWGDGSAPLDWTTWEDTARFIAHAALDEREVPEQLFVSGDRKSMLEFADAVAAVRARPTTERLGSLDELRKELAQRRQRDPGNPMAWLPLMYAQGLFEGQALLGPLANARYPEIHAETLRDALARGAL